MKGRLSGTKTSASRRGIERVVLSLPVWHSIVAAVRNQHQKTSGRQELMSAGVLLGTVHDGVFTVEEWNSGPKRGHRAVPLLAFAGSGRALSRGIWTKAKAHGNTAAVVAVRNDSDDLPPRFYRRDNSRPEGGSEIPCMTYEPQKDFFTRLKGTHIPKRLSDSRVAIVGLGSIGGLLAWVLVHSGIRRFILMDFDILEPSNLSRHVCTEKDLGRLKVHAVADLLRQVNPTCEIQTLAIDVSREPLMLESAIKSSTIVAVASDSDVSRYLCNEFALKHDIPAVYGGAHPNLAGSGHILRVSSRLDPCYDCVVGWSQKDLPRRMQMSVERPPSYIGRRKTVAPTLLSSLAVNVFSSCCGMRFSHGA